MKLTILLLLLFIVACQKNVQTQEAAESESSITESEANTDEPMVLERKTSSFSIKIEKEEVPEYIFHIMSIIDSQGKKVDELRITKLYSSSTGCDTHSTSEYDFSSDTEFQIVTNTKKHSCGVESGDPASGVSEEEFLRIENPYEIVDREMESSQTTFYEISEKGKIVKGESRAELINDKISKLERFDVLPKENLRLLRNYIFAKHGYKFKSQDLLSHFSATDWYEPKFDNVDELLTAKDNEIIAYLTNLESTEKSP
jgi:hypothetical protein